MSQPFDAGPAFRANGFGKMLFLNLAQFRERLDDAIAGDRGEIWIDFGNGIEHVRKKMSMMRADFNEVELLRPADLLPASDKKMREQSAEERANRDARQKIALLADTILSGRVVAELRMIERQLH